MGRVPNADDVYGPRNGRFDGTLGGFDVSFIAGKKSSVRILAALSLCLLASNAARATTTSACDAPLLDAVNDARAIVLSLRPEKPGQSRVIANDLSEYTGGQSIWMRDELRVVERACLHDEGVEATRHLQAVLELLRSHGSARATAVRATASAP